MSVFEAKPLGVNNTIAIELTDFSFIISNSVDYAAAAERRAN